MIWLAEAFTRPAMMHGLGKIGFQQSYTYYAWRNEKWDLESYCQELARDSAPYMRPSFWPTTHDILTPYMTNGGPAAWKVRAALAATLVPTYGIYAGYELMENSRGRARRSRSTTRSTNSRTGTGRTTRNTGPRPASRSRRTWR